GAVEGRLREAVEQFHPDAELMLEALVRGYLAVHSHPDALGWVKVWEDYAPRSVLPRLYRGRAYHLSRRPDRAIADYRHVLERLPNQPEARLWLAGALTMDGQFREALAEFESYLRGHPDNPAGLLGLAHCQFSLSRLDAARATLEKRSARRADDAA